MAKRQSLMDFLNPSLYDGVNLTQQGPPMSQSTTWKNSFEEAQQVLNNFTSNQDLMGKCLSFSDKLTETFKNDGKVFSCGNGGSHCDAMHFAEELTGRYRKDRRPLGALALGDSSHVT